MGKKKKNNKPDDKNEGDASKQQPANPQGSGKGPSQSQAHGSGQQQPTAAANIGSGQQQQASKKRDKGPPQLEIQTREQQSKGYEKRQPTPTQPSAWGPSLSQATASGQSQSQAPAWGQPQSQAPAWGQPQNQAPAWGQPQSQAPAWGQPQASISTQQTDKTKDKGPIHQPNEGNQPPAKGRGKGAQMLQTFKEPQVMEQSHGRQKGQPQERDQKSSKQIPQSEQSNIKQENPQMKQEAIRQQGKEKSQQKQKTEAQQKQKEATLPQTTQSPSLSKSSSVQSFSASQSDSKKQLSPYRRNEWKPEKDSLSVLQLNPNSRVGTRGTKVRYDVNYLKMNLDKLSPKAYHYDIRFDPDKPKKLLPLVFEQFRQQHFPKHYLAFDGANNVYSSKLLKFSGNVLKTEIVYSDEVTKKDRKYEIQFKETDTIEIDMSAISKYTTLKIAEKPLRALQCLEIVMRAPFTGKCVQVNRSFYTKPLRPIDLGSNFELWTGLYQSVVLGQAPLFNIDVVNKPFPAGNEVLYIVDRLLRLDPNREMDNYSQRDLVGYLSGLNIVYHPTGEIRSTVYKFQGLKDSARTQTFIKDGQKLTIEKYFRDKNIPLKFPNLPCLWCGSTMKNIYLPLEFCSIQEGQPVRKKVDEEATRIMIRETATSTDERKRKIMELLQKIKHNTDNTVKEFGVSVGDKFETVDARILQPPNIEYDGNVTSKVSQGVWRAEGNRFIDPKSCRNWAVLKIDDRLPDNVVRDFARMISDVGRKANMNISQDYDIQNLRANCRPSDIDQMMNALKPKNLDILFVVLPNRAETYSLVKQAAELKTGILTQCIKSFTISRKMNGSTAYNILLKVNSKLNGTNHKIQKQCNPPIVSTGKFMLVGADVTHPTGGMKEDPSVVGVAASHDLNAFKYNICWRLQDPTKEMIGDLKEIFMEQLQYYKKMVNDLPDKILYYRDGVSDGQFQQVLNIELAAIYSACQQTGGMSYKPNVTFIVVQKRHNTRFFPGNSRVSCGKNNNVVPGTIVDTYITDPREYQFFLVSHLAIQGVAKPTKYCVIWDDSNIAADQLQALTYNLCHLFTRCDRAVSYVAPTYYAHLAAARGKVYVTGQRIRLDKLDQEFRSRQIKNEIVKEHPMYFV